MKFQNYIKNNSNNIKIQQKKWQKLSLNKRIIPTHKKRRIFLKKTYFLIIFSLTLSALLVNNFLIHKNNNNLLSPIPAEHKNLYNYSDINKQEQLKKILENISITIDNNYTATTGGVMVKNLNGEEYIFDLNKNISQQTSSLQLIKTKLTIDGKRLKTADFRFDDPVITLY